MDCRHRTPFWPPYAAALPPSPPPSTAHCLHMDTTITSGTMAEADTTSLESAARAPPLLKHQL